MKLIIVLMFLSSIAYGRWSNGGSVWSDSTTPFSQYIRGKDGLFMLRYPVLSWEQLQFRRDALSTAITDLRNLSRNNETLPYLTAADVHPLLYSIMEHTVAIHSGLPRTGRGLEEEDLLSPLISPDGSISATSKHLEDIKFSVLENSYVPEKVWKLYTQWGHEVREEIESVLTNTSIAKVIHDDQRNKFLQMFADEFSQDKTRNIFSLSKGGQHGTGADRYDLKIDLPALSAIGEVGKLYNERWPAGFLADIELPQHVDKQLEELSKYIPKEVSP